MSDLAPGGSPTPVPSLPRAEGRGESELLRIPRLGIIRARALAKAGWRDLASLRQATIEQLMEVSGISEAKARQIAEFVASLPAEAEERRAEPPEPIEWPVEADLLVQAVHKLTYAARAALIRVDQGVLEYELYAELCKWVKRFGIYASDPLRDIERSLNTAGDVVRLRAQLEAALTLEKMPKPLQRELAKGLARSRKLLKQLG